MLSTLLLLALVPAAQQAEPQDDTPPRPDVVVILTDDQGWADVGFHNPAHVVTPSLDRLAANGALLGQHYAMPQCTPTRVALLTGRYPSRFGEHAQQASNGPAFPHGTPTLASLLAGAGYATHLVGKWHLGSDPGHGPNHFGFDTSYGSLAGAVGMYDHRYREGPYEHTWHRDHELVEDDERGRHATDLVADEAVRRIEAATEQPLFLYLAFHAPHTPLDERGPFVDRPTQLDPDDPTRWLGEDEIPWFHDPDGRIQAEPDPEKRLFLAAVQHLDHAIGRVVDALERTGRLEDTLLLFSSDNGPQVSWPGDAYPDDLRLSDFNQPDAWRGHKCDVWEGGIRVPGLVHWPARIEPHTVAGPTHVVDFLPTVAAVLDLPLPGADGREAEPFLLDGQDLSPALLRAEALPARTLYWTWADPTNRRALRHGAHKLVHYGRADPAGPGAWSLFDLSTDPTESTDLAPTRPDLLRALHARYLELRAGDAER